MLWTVVLEKTLESPLDSKEIKPLHPNGDQSWVFIGRTVVYAETPILWPPDAKIWLIGKDPDAGKDWRQEEKGMAEDKMVGWHHQLNGQIWASSRRWWRTGKPGILQSVQSQSWIWLSSWTELSYQGSLYIHTQIHISVQFSSVTQLWPTVCDPMDCSTPGFPVHHQLLELAQTHVHRIGDAIQPSHPLLSPSPPTFNPSQHQGLFQGISSSHQVAKVLEFQHQHQSFSFSINISFH